MDWPKELMCYAPNELRDFLDSFDKVFVDCDGVVWCGYEPIDRTSETLKWLEENGKQVIFVSNNSTIKVKRFCELFTRMGLNVSEEDVVIPSKVIAWYLKKMDYKDEAYVISSTAFRELLTAEGIRISDPSPSDMEESLPLVLKMIRGKPPAKAVIFDFDVNCNWIKLNVASELLKENDVLFIIGGVDKSIRISPDVLLIGPEPFCNILIDHCKRKPIECGKPSAVLKEYIFEKYNITKPERCIFVGDSLRNDMEFGVMCNFQNLFVGSGVNSLSEVGKITKTIPDYYLPTLGHLSHLLTKTETK